jgi:hypothetical protein
VNAVIDPSSPITMVSHTFAHRLHLAEHESRSITAYGVTAELPTVGPLTIDIHPATFRLARVAIETPEMENHAPADVDVILGADALSAATLRLDVARHRLSSLSSSDIPRMKKRSTAENMQLDGTGHISVSVRIGNASPSRAILDLGSDTAVTVNRQFAITHGILLPENTEVAQRGHGHQPSSRINIAFGKANLMSDSIKIVDEAEYPLILGLAFFEGRSVIFDLNENEIRISN